MRQQVLCVEAKTAVEVERKLNKRLRGLGPNWKMDFLQTNTHFGPGSKEKLILLTATISL